jgi:hypothetical protein
MKITYDIIVQAGKDWEAYKKYSDEHADDKFNAMKPKLLTFRETYGYQILIFDDGSVKFEGERYSPEVGLLYKKGDRVKLPFGETGTVIKGNEFAWMKVYKVRIRKAVFNKTNEKVEFFERQINYE